MGENNVLMLGRCRSKENGLLFVSSFGEVGSGRLEHTDESLLSMLDSCRHGCINLTIVSPGGHGGGHTQEW